MKDQLHYLCVASDPLVLTIRKSSKNTETRELCQEAIYLFFLWFQISRREWKWKREWRKWRGRKNEMEPEALEDDLLSSQFSSQLSVEDNKSSQTDLDESDVNRDLFLRMISSDAYNNTDLPDYYFYESENEEFWSKKD
jgi:hypothetical protein